MAQASVWCNPDLVITLYNHPLPSNIPALWNVGIYLQIHTTVQPTTSSSKTLPPWKLYMGICIIWYWLTVMGMG
jgi:hypothetical protein